MKVLKNPVSGENMRQTPEEYLNKDQMKNACWIYYLCEEKDKTNIYVAYDGEDIIGMLGVYTGGSYPCVLLRQGAPSKLLEKFKARKAVFEVPLEHADAVKRKFSVLNEYLMIVMTLKKGEERVEERHECVRLKEKDAKSVAKLWTEWRGGSISDYIEGFKQGLMDKERCHFYGIFDEDELVSAIYAKLLLPEILEIKGIYTKAPYRQRGYATSMLCRAIKFAPESVKKIRLSVRSDNEAAKKLYQKIGFKEYWRFKWLDLGVGFSLYRNRYNP